MLSLVNVCVNYGRIQDDLRTCLIDATKPVRVSWGAQTDRKNAYQSECRVTLRGNGYSWDSGWVSSRKQSLCCEGTALPIGEFIRISLCIRDDAGQESDVWVGRIMNVAVPWMAKWIAASQDIIGRTVYFRREFNVRKNISAATLYACGLGCHRLSINGESVDSARMDPAQTDWFKTCLYAVYPDVKGFLRPGINCIGAIIGNGWRRNALTSRECGCPYENRRFAGRPQLSAMLQIQYANGEETWVCTDNSWQQGWGALRNNDLFDGEAYDANQTVHNWDRPGCDEFTPAIEVASPGGAMRPMLLEPIRGHGTYEPVCSWALGENRWVFDFGQNISGVIRLPLPKGLRQGQRIRITHAEELDEDGALYRKPLRSARAEDTYIASGDERDLLVWQPLMTMHGFRYAMIEGLHQLPRPEAVEYHTNLQRISFFRCGDALVNRIHELCVRTEQANQQGVLIDCPQRDERMGWLNDGTVRFQETPFNFDIGRMFPKLLRDVADTQECGAISDTAPRVYGSVEADPVCSSFLIAGMEAWMHTDNLDVLREYYENFAAWENYLLHRSEDWLVNYGCHGDWAGPSYACLTEQNGDRRFSAVTPPEYMAAGYSYLNCRLLQKMATGLDKNEEAQQWNARAIHICQAMIEKWYDQDTARICTGSQGAQAFALWLGIIPRADMYRAAERIHNELVANNYKITTGNLTTRYMMDVLTEYGYLEDAWTLITRTEYPSLGYMIQHEATTVWERFELKKDPGMNSHNHPMYGALDYWLFTYLCGIRLLSPGYEKVLIKPYMPVRLLSAQATLDTIKGPLTVRWMKKYGQRHLHVVVPFGTKALVEFGGQVREVGSGWHGFTMPLTEKEKLMLNIEARGED